jgi:hypothetical protein
MNGITPKTKGVAMVEKNQEKAKAEGYVPKIYQMLDLCEKRPNRLIFISEFPVTIIFPTPVVVQERQAAWRREGWAECS